MELTSLGWNSHFSDVFTRLAGDGMVAARVVSDQRHIYTILCAQGELAAEVSGRFRMEAGRKIDFPVVGDWVASAARPAEGKATIHAVLPRASLLSRRSPGEKTEEQPVAANLDSAFIVTSLDWDFNVRRIERYLTLAWASGIQPVVVLNKADLCGEVEEKIAEVARVAVGVPVVATSAASGAGLEELQRLLGPGRTTAFLGSSGVGKSSIINRILGFDRQDTGAVREDDSRGRHTTTARELIILPSGGLLIDNPGMREVGLWADDSDLRGAFDDIEQIAASCRFSDCSHLSEPGCAVRQALEEARLEPDRYASYLKLRKELAWVATREDERLRLEQKRKQKELSRRQKSFRKDGR